MMGLDRARSLLVLALLLPLCTACANEGDDSQDALSAATTTQPFDTTSTQPPISPADVQHNDPKSHHLDDSTCRVLSLLITCVRGHFS